MTNRRRPLPGFVRSVRRILRPVKMRLVPSPTDAVKSNTKKAFEYFYSDDTFVTTQYLEPNRLAFYDLVAASCAEIVRAECGRGPVRVVDIGCGTGHLLLALKGSLRGDCALSLSGLDFAAAAVRRARTLVPEATFYTQDLYDNALPSRFFDLVMSTETLEHLRTPERALEQLVRVCRPKQGTIVVTVPNGEHDTWDGHVNHWGIEAFRSLLSPYGAVDARLIHNDRIILARLRP